MQYQKVFYYACYWIDFSQKEPLMLSESKHKYLLVTWYKVFAQTL